MSTICDDLRAAILQAAMQGKLTKQLPEDGSAEDLLKEIKAEKEKLIAEGKIKKQKPLAPITDDEIPFNIPENWKWVRLPDISESLLGKTLNKSIDNGAEKPYLCSINIYWNGVNLNNVKTAKFSQNDIDQYRLSKNDLLICEGGDVGRSAIWDLDSEMYYQNALHRIRFYGGINVEYIHKLLNCYKRIGLIDDYSKGVTIKHLVQSALNQIPIPLPPLAEQKRIVEKVDELMARIADLEQSADALASLKKVFPDDIKASLLQAAMQGKLTKQLPEDGNAEDLLKEIKAEKEKLIAEGKIKKQKPLAPITDDEIPFSIPENWGWVRLGNLTEPCEYPYADGPFGSNLKKEHYTTRREVRIIQLSNIDDGGWKDKNVKYTTYEHLKTIERSATKCGDIVIAKMMPAGRAMIVPDVEESYVLSSDAVKIVPNHHVDTRYLEKFLNSPIFQRQVYSDVQGITRIRTSLSKLIGYLVAVPPLAEQRRIVERLDTLMQNINVVEDLIASE